MYILKMNHLQACAVAFLAHRKETLLKLRMDKLVWGRWTWVFAPFLLQYISVYNHEYIQFFLKIPHANCRKIFSFLEAGSEK